MLTSPHLSGKQLADLCHRLAISTESGIEIRRTWERESQSATGALKQRYQKIHQGVSQGDSLSTCLAKADGLFPRLFLELVHVGEQTGSLAEVLRRLSRHYQRQSEMLRDFRRRLAWPLIQLVAAVIIIGAFILVLGAIDARGVSGKPLDVLGLGVTGKSAFTLYATIVSMAALGIFAAAYSIQRGMLWVRPLQHWVMRVPAVGPAIEKLCLARLAWALHLTLNVDMDLRRLIPLVLRSTGSDYYISRTKEVADAVAVGSPLHDAFAATGIFPAHFLDALYVAEESGQLVESLSRLSSQYEEEADSAVNTLTTLLGFAVWGCVMLVIVMMIFRVAMIYIGQINEALEL